MTEIEFSDWAGVSVKTVAARRVALGLCEGTHFVCPTGGDLVLTDEGQKRLEAAFGLQGVCVQGEGATTAPRPSCDARTAQNAPVVLVKVLRAKPNETQRNNRYFVAVVVDEKTGCATTRVATMFVPTGGKAIRQGRLVRALDMGDVLLLDSMELRRRGVTLR